MSRIGLSLACGALSVLESGLAAGKTPDTGVLLALNAGLGAIAAQGMEPSDNTVQAIGNLTSMLFPAPSGEAEAPVGESGDPVPPPSPAGVEQPASETAPVPVDAPPAAEPVAPVAAEPVVPADGAGAEPAVAPVEAAAPADVSGVNG